MTINIKAVKREEKLILRNLLELYQHDMSEFNGADVNEHGEYGYNYLDQYWTEPSRFPFLIKISDELAGFALIREISSGEDKYFSMAEFFILRKFRHCGLGRNVASQLFERFKGEWRVAQEVENHPAQEFWHKVISSFTKGNFELIEEKDCDGPVIKFTVDKREN
ncbi:MAG: GNAT family N-acetyltransferase [Anaerolineales bacterium]|nr:GNAT family N-acetyltransferase [Chloroflexota bacterium]MBL6981825.1 GNAT family N-acetyltransferase [Anaerolineales bacterium]